MDIHPREMRRRVDEVAAFTELGDYLDMPVRTYSSGMMIRLAFGVSTCIPPEILVMDEWLAAGDANFLAKAQKRMEEFVRDANILVLASHSLHLLKSSCKCGILLQHGKIEMVGTIEDAISAYQQIENRPSSVREWQAERGVGDPVYLRGVPNQSWR